jgi:hypothetical protein
MLPAYRLILPKLPAQQKSLNRLTVDLYGNGGGSNSNSSSSSSSSSNSSI